MAFDLDSFVSECAVAVAESTPELAIREAVIRAVSEPEALCESLGAPVRAEIRRLHASTELTVLNVVWAPGMTIMPHNHNMWAVIGVYGGREDNIFWRRLDERSENSLEAAGAKSLGPREAHPLGREVVHSVTNPTARLTGAIHVYGGDFFATERSEWDPETLRERPYDIEKNLRLFEESNPSGD